MTEYLIQYGYGEETGFKYGAKELIRKYKGNNDIVKKKAWRDVKRIPSFFTFLHLKITNLKTKEVFYFNPNDWKVSRLKSGGYSNGRRYHYYSRPSKRTKHTKEHKKYLL